MRNDDLKELLFGHIREMFGDEDVLQKRWEASRVQACDRSQRSRILDYTPPQEVRDQNHNGV
jgi:hypothetical protein